jgi:hypothetical protein
MNQRNNRGKIAGLALHLLIGGLMIPTGLQKLLRSVPPEALVSYGLDEQMRLIGAGALLTAALLLIPRTSSLGVLLVSSFWGGAICIHMAHGEPYLFQAVLLVLSWVGAYLRNTATFSSFSGPSGATREVAAESQPASSRPGPGYDGLYMDHGTESIFVKPEGGHRECSSRSDPRRRRRRMS